MTENKNENGIYIPKDRPEPTETDQNAGMPKDPHGRGLTQSQSDTKDGTRQSDQAGSMANPAEKDAGGQYAKTRSGGKNDGLSSAKPKVTSGQESGDSTFAHTFKGVAKK